MKQSVSERCRVLELHRLRILDTAPEPWFDLLVQDLADVTGCPVALVSLVASRRQWFKARYGLQIAQMRRQISFCSHTIRYAGPFEVRNATADRRFRTNPLVTGSMHLRYYAGVPLTTSSGARVGALCVIDTQPRDHMHAWLWRLFWSSARTIMSAMEQNALRGRRVVTSGHLPCIERIYLSNDVGSIG